MRKLILLTVALLCMAFMSQAENAMKLRIIPKVGEELILEFSQRPEVSFINGSLQVTADSQDNVTYDFDDIDRIQLESSNSEVNEVASSPITIFSRGGNIIFGNVPAGSLVEIYTISGIRMALNHVGGEYVLSRSDFPRGTYLVRINNNAFKVIL